MKGKMIVKGKLVALACAVLVSVLCAQLAFAQDTPIVDGLLDDLYVFYQHFDGDPDGGTSFAPGDVYTFDPGTGDVCYWALVVPRSFNENVYADDDKSYTQYFGWIKGHTFFDLEESDGALFNIEIDGVAQDVWLDYLNETSGNYTSGETGDETTAVGCAKDATTCSDPYVIDAATSLYYNMTDPSSGWTGQEGHSPPIDYNDTSGYYWEWQMIYEFTTPKQSDGSCAEVIWAGAHNSPTKNDDGKTELGSIGDFVWLDDNDGIQEPGEFGVPGVTVTLYYRETPTGPWLEYGTTQTDSNGYYYFTQLEYGEYYVNFTLPYGYDFTIQNAGGDDTIDSDADSQGDTAVITLAKTNPYQMYWDAGLVGGVTAARVASFSASSGTRALAAAVVVGALLMAAGVLGMALRSRET